MKNYSLLFEKTLIKHPRTAPASPHNKYAEFFTDKSGETDYVKHPVYVY